MQEDMRSRTEEFARRERFVDMYIARQVGPGSDFAGRLAYDLDSTDKDYLKRVLRRYRGEALQLWELYKEVIDVA